VLESRIPFDFEHSKHCRFRGLAVESFLGFSRDSDLLRQHGQTLYLQYLSEKIALFLHIEQNIRLCRARLIFARTPSDTYCLVDAEVLEFENLTPALRRMEQRSRQREETLAQRVLLKEEQYEQLRGQEGRPQVRALEEAMNAQFYRAAGQLKAEVGQNSLLEAERNEAAFDKLFPKYCSQMGATLSTMGVRDLRARVVSRKQRKSLARPPPLNRVSGGLRQPYN
jgi:hypothetical protein